ncbi:MAG: metallophosphoesterase [Pseudoalteromonas sp.]|uniref:metallophosphoesterase n=1 Tax=Pseudoalteromonas sp. TaxID=53249 RepID=UPI001E121897|nr:metallophosphoesterase [Pseudoalteromonas sp.]NRA78767.1 metallophosphoesterase [Pseudoalteromonas sp.]
MGDFRPRLKGNKLKSYLNLNKEENRVLVVGDIHSPFDLDNYFDFCLDTYEKYNCNKVVFIGDVIDSHYSSYHETDADGMGGLDELELAIKRLRRWYNHFPDAHVTLGNHDRIIVRKAQTSNIPSKWIKEFGEVLETPKWKFVTDVYIDGVRYVHGDKSGKPRMAAKRDMVSTVSGHYHTDMYVEWFFGKTRAIFGMAVACGIDSRSYGMAYMQGGKKEAIGCGVVIGGHTAFNVKMNL